MIGNIYGTTLIEVRQYVATDGRSPFADWFETLDAVTAARIAVSVERLAAGNVSGLKGAGHGLLELRIDFGPGYRLYLGRDGMTLIILLGGGTKKRQQHDIATAQARWQDYKDRKKRET